MEKTKRWWIEMLKFCSKNRRGNHLIKYINHILSKMDLQSYEEKTNEQSYLVPLPPYGNDDLEVTFRQRNNFNK